MINKKLNEVQQKPDAFLMVSNNVNEIVQFAEENNNSNINGENTAHLSNQNISPSANIINVSNIYHNPKT